MSWSEYITRLTDSKQVKEACIVSKEDGSVWASTPDFCPRSVYKYNESAIDEIDMLKGLAKADAVRPTSFHFNGGKYMVLNSPSPGCFYMKAGSRVGYKGGAVFLSGSQCILFCTYCEEDGQNGGGCNIIAHEVMDFLRENGF